MLETPSLLLEGRERRPQGAPGVCTNDTGSVSGLADCLSRPFRGGVPFFHLGGSWQLSPPWGGGVSPPGMGTLCNFPSWRSLPPCTLGKPCYAGNSGGNGTGRCSGVRVGPEAFILVAPPFPRVGGVGLCKRRESGVCPVELETDGGECAKRRVLSDLPQSLPIQLGNAGPIWGSSRAQ